MGLPLKYEKVAVKMAANAEGAGIPAPFVCIYTFVHLRGLLHSLCSLVIPYARRGALDEKLGKRTSICYLLLIGDYCTRFARW